jgi:hypothetical protein
MHPPLSITLLRVYIFLRSSPGDFFGDIRIDTYVPSLAKASAYAFYHS